MRNNYKIVILEIEFGLDLELHKKFQGMNFREFYELATKVTKYKELFREDNLKRR